MSDRKYTPTETDLALHPKREIRTCRAKGCGVKFAARAVVAGSKDDPGRCLACNRKSWSKLFAHVRAEEKIEGGSIDSVVVRIRKGRAK